MASRTVVPDIVPPRIAVSRCSVVRNIRSDLQNGPGQNNDAVGWNGWAARDLRYIVKSNGFDAWYAMTSNCGDGASQLNNTPFKGAGHLR